MISLLAINMLALMSPGPDFVMITRSSLLYSRRTGIIMALGFACGVFVHMSYILAGIGFIIAESIVAYSIVKYAGAAYLMYIGVKSLKSKKKVVKEEGDLRVGDKHPGDLAAWKMGFFTNILNPKAALFFLAVFSQVISPGTPSMIKIVYGTEFAIMTFCWFSFVAIVLSHGKIKGMFAKIQGKLEKVFGALLIAFGIKIATSK